MTRRPWGSFAQAVALAVLPLVVLLATGNLALFAHPFWLDEVFTYLLVADPSAGRALASLAAGVDYNPPGLHVLLRATSPLLGGPGEVSFRVVAFASVLVASLFTWGTLRRAAGPAAAWAGAASLWAVPLVAEHAFEARFYGPWLMYAAAWAWLRGLPVGRHGWAVEVGLGVAAVGICTIHYFGVLSLLLLVAGDVLFVRQGDTPWAGLRRNTASVAGVLALAACLPLLASQRAASDVPTWIPPTDLDAVLAVAGAFWWTPASAVACAALLCAALLCVAAAWLWRRAGETAMQQDAPPGPPGIRWRPVAPLLALAGMPLLVLAVSLLVQPAMRPAYAMPTALALPAVLALATDRLPRVARLVACGLLVAGGVSSVQTAEMHHGWRSQRQADFVRILDADAGSRPVVFTSWHVPVPVARRRADLAGRLLMLRAGPVQSLGRSDAMTQDLAAVLQARYGVPRLVEVAALPDSFWLQAPPGGGWAVSTLREAGYTVRHVTGEQWLAERAVRE
ncbi:MAG: hypothetical protein ACFCVE_13295 [Phycisphaerae bacterium]